MEINIDAVMEYINQFLLMVITDFTTASDLGVVYLVFIKYWGWALVFVLFIIYAAFPLYMNVIQIRWYKKNFTTTLLAIDVPKRNEQSIKAMENFFDYLQGAHTTLNPVEKYFKGHFQLSFSIELVSIGGNVQFIIRTPTHFRNLVEAGIYSQFPDAEITEVEDYTKGIPLYYPDDKYDVWGCEFTLSDEKYLPLKTYTRFEDNFADVYADPMAAMLETMSAIGPNEQMWLQYLIKPLEVMWGKDGKQYVDKIMEKPAPAPKKGVLDYVMGFMGNVVTEVMGVTAEAGSEEKMLRFPNLTPGQKEQAELVQGKISKLAFDTKVRYCFIGEKGNMNKALGVNGFVGAIKQWTDMNANGLRPEIERTGTSGPKYWLVERRRNYMKGWIMRGYVDRDRDRGCTAKPFSSEEMASLWHFPSIDVKAPMLKSTDFTKASAPVSLPIERKKAVQPVPEVPQSSIEGDIQSDAQVIKPNFDYDTDDFEMQFAKDKEGFKKNREVRNERLKQAEMADQQQAQATQVNQPESNKQQSINQHPSQSQAENDDQIKTPGNLPFLD